ncbi:MAG: ABC transporter permease subunit, partial [Rubritalea sp.]|uniref:PhnE/PtxC family ABC transporter permease n=1 Tax=Rubritalea sp. TaxID=2109375 RepID=UPI003242AACE
SQTFIGRTLEALLTTIRYAFIAMSMAVPAGLALGFLCSRSWWPTTLHDRSPSISRKLNRATLNAIYLSARFSITFMRSIHELIWVMLFMAFLGDSPLTACIALALPFTGTLAKVFSEIIDEQSSHTTDHLKLAGASSLKAFFAARFPQALPDLLTYTLYRLECAIRSSAVLGFIGIETIGLSIKQSYENNYYNEVWTELYLLIFVVMLFDILGSKVRHRLSTPAVELSIPSDLSLKSLKKCAPKWQLLPLTWSLLLLGSIAAWTIGPPLNVYHSAISRWDRTKVFFEELVPEPVRATNNWNDALPWLMDLWTSNGIEALLNTMLIASSALLLAAVFGYLLVPFASRNIATFTPFSSFNGRPSQFKKWLWSTIGFCVRTLFLVTRSIPEYIIAFLLIGILGAHAWPLVIALAIHNFGILGRLWSEVSENHHDNVARQQVVSGGSRLQAYICGILPTSFNRQLLFIFYRWETCVRESTILGMLSISSLGYYISIESSFLHYDRMHFYILLGTAVIFISDLVSVKLRAKLNKSGSNG